MITRFKAAAVFVVATLVLAMPLVAQSWPSIPGTLPAGPDLVDVPQYSPFPALPQGPAGLQSNQSKATAGVFGSEVDDSMSVLWHSANGEAEDKAFDKWLAFVGYGGNTNYNPVHLGYATRFGSIYLGTWYTGSIAKSFDYTSKKVTNTYSLATQLQTNSLTETTYYNFMTTSNNQIEALIGVAGMGFKVGFWESMYQSKNPNVTTTVTDDQGGVVSYTNEIVDHENYGGHLMPSLEWGMKIGAGNLEIRPTFRAAIDIYQDKQLLNTKEDYSTLSGVLPSGEPDLASEGRNNGYVNPQFNLNVGVALPAPEKTSKSFDVGYGISFGVFSNDYDVFGFSDKVKGTVSWEGSSTVNESLVSTSTARSVDLDITEIDAALEHNISIGYYYDKEIVDNFTIGLYTALPFTIGVESKNQYNKNFSTGRVEYERPEFGVSYTQTSETIGQNTVTDTTVFGMNPYCNLGAKYALFPGRFQINAGIHLAPFGLETTTTKVSTPKNHGITTIKRVDDNGNVLSESVTGGTTPVTSVDSTTVENKWSPFAASFSGGFVFLFNNHAALDLAAGYTPSSSFNLETTYVNVLVTVKF